MPRRCKLTITYQWEDGNERYVVSLLEQPQTIAIDVLHSALPRHTDVAGVQIDVNYEAEPG